MGPTMRMDRSCCWKGDFSALLRGKVTFLVGRVCLVLVNTALCPVCGCPMIRHGRTSSGRQRWRCKPCKITTLNEIDSTAKHLDEPGSLAVAVRWICLVGAARFVGVVSRCGSYGLSARSSMRFMRSSSSMVSTWAEASWCSSPKHPIVCWAGTRPGVRIPGPGARL